MSAFPAEDLEKLNEDLARRRLQLLVGIRTKLAEARGERVGADETSSIDVGDRAFLDLASEMDLAIADRDIQQLRDVEAAQQRIAARTFGICTDCGEPIAMARLRAFPTAQRCSACQTAEEARQRNPLHKT
jgi:RNA polymerase-binding protein DksA